MVVPIIDNADARRFELEEDGELAFARYRRDGKTLYIDYVEAALALRGTGAAGRLMEAIAERAKQNGWRIVPICGYAVAWLRRHGEYHDLLA